jgi:hypothetical protein
MPMSYATDRFRSEIVSEQIIAIMCVGEVDEHLRACGAWSQAGFKLSGPSKRSLASILLLSAYFPLINLGI